MLSFTTRCASCWSAKATMQRVEDCASAATSTVTALMWPPAWARVSTQKHVSLLHQSSPGSSATGAGRQLSSHAIVCTTKWRMCIGGSTLERAWCHNVD